MHSTASRLGAMVLALALLPAVAAQAQIAGSSHDLSSGGSGPSYNGSSSQTCIYCHTPHSAGTNDVPLWNRSLATSGFTMYTSPTLTPGTIGTQPGAVSRACLSCHDGVGVPGNYTGSGFTGTTAITGTANIGTNLGNDHPIALTVTATPVSGITNRSTWTGLPLFGTGADQLECATCHDPHNQGAPTAGHMLRATNAGSALCTTCHIK
jgi:predicted CXXCH cytochrome family protein